MKKSKVTILLLILFSATMFSQNVLKNAKGYYLPNKLYIKLSETVTRPLKGETQVTSALQSRLSAMGVTSVKQAFPVSKSDLPEAASVKRIMEVEYATPYDPVVMAKKMSGLRGVEWAEPRYLDRVTYVPDDPGFNSEQSLQRISAEEAWDITKGSPDVIIGIVDTGVDWNHPDLMDNIWINEAEQNGTPGVDDDNNGFVDDIRGWDFGGLNGNPDNNPMEDQSDHGTHVAGCAAAVTDNGIGVSSIGFNSTIMAIKTSRNDVRDDDNNALIYYGYQGIIYAAENGADIINCSWGGYNYSIANREIIEYVTSLGSLVIGAAGNENTSDYHYPSSYKEVLSVGATNSANDQKAYFSNYGEQIDLMTPGVSIYNTWQNDRYASLSGTSMAAPITAGLAALVKEHFPDYLPQQVAEQIRVNTDDIYGDNPGDLYMLGTGRTNAYKALSNQNSKSVRVSQVTYNELGIENGVFEPGEQLSVSIEFFNYLNATNSLSIELTSDNGYVTIDDANFEAGQIDEYSAFDNAGSEFTFTIGEDVPTNTEISFILNYDDDGYTDFEFITVNVNPTYATQEANLVSMTITSNGTFGYNDYADNTEGEGFRFDRGPNLMFEGALMYGTSSSNLANAARNNSGEFQDNDFQNIIPFTIDLPGDLADAQGYAKFTDNNVGIETELHSYSYSLAPLHKTIILKYLFKNTTGSDINGFYSGLFFDWDIDGEYYDRNVVEYDNDGNYGVAYVDNRSLFETIAAAALVSSDDHNFYAINNDGAGDSFEIYDGFSDNEKFVSISSGLSQTDAGPNDIAFVIAGGPYNIPAGESIDVGFAISADTTFGGISEQITAARDIYEDLILSVKDMDPSAPDNYSLRQNYPNPFNPSTVIEFSVAERSDVNLKVYDVLGREVAVLVNKTMERGRYEARFDASSLSSGVYFYTLQAGEFKTTKKMMLLR